MTTKDAMERARKRAWKVAIKWQESFPRKQRGLWSAKDIERLVGFTTAALLAFRKEELEKLKMAMMEHSPGGRWNWDGFAEEACEIIDEAIRKLKEE